jgi:hypothetical protein
VDDSIRKLREMLAADPLDFVPASRRPAAELDLRVAEYLMMLGLPPDSLAPGELDRQEQMIAKARMAFLSSGSPPAASSESE